MVKMENKVGDWPWICFYVIGSLIIYANDLIYSNIKGTNEELPSQPKLSSAAYIQLIIPRL